MNDEALINCLNTGGVAVIRTDTLYGLVARADDEAAVERVYKIKQRANHKPCIILIDTIESVSDWVNMEPWQDQYRQLWPGPISIIVPTIKPGAPEWLVRGGDTLALRQPDDLRLTSLLRSTGPLIAPSANPEGEPLARSIQEAKAYFGDEVDYYADGGSVTDTRSSRLVRLTADNDPEWLR